MRPLACGVLAALALTACGEDSGTRLAADGMSYEIGPFGSTPGGAQVDRITLRGRDGTTLDVLTFGGIVTRLLVPDREGRLADVVLGYDGIGSYVAGSPYFGAIVGRYGNRIAGGRFILDGKEHRLATNNGPNHLHGGDLGFDRAVWHAEPYASELETGVVLSHVSPDGDEGYPGELAVRVTYALTASAELRIDYEATTTAPTVLNLTHHGYWNLAGHDSGDILDHELVIRAGRFTPVDETLIPTGEIRSVEGTPFDFRQGMRIGARIEEDDEQIRYGGGYDHNFVIDGWRDGGDLREVATLRDPASGRRMDVLTTEPGLQFYSGNFLDGSDIGKGRTPYLRRSALCLETQHFPDSPNQPAFPSTVLRPGEIYRSTTVYRFSAE